MHISLKVTIYGSDRKLLEVKMQDGKIEADVPADVAKLPEWKGPIRVAVLRAKEPKADLGSYQTLP